MKRIMAICILGIVFVSGCIAGKGGGTVTGQEKPVNEAGSAGVFHNLDAYEQYGIVGSTVLEYASKDLERMRGEPIRTDYVEVVRQFVEQELKSGLHFLDTADGTYNPRRVTVGTTDGRVYAFILNRWHHYDEIWTVGSYSLYGEGKDEGTAPRDNTVAYRELDIGQAEETVKKWVENAVATKQSRQDYLIVNGKVYILLAAAEGQAIELMSIHGDDHLIGVAYARYSADPDNRYGQKPYTLLQVDSPVSELVFSQYGAVEREHLSLYIP